MKKILIASLVGLSLSLSASVTLADGHAKKQASSEKQAKTAVTFRKAILQLVRSNMGPLGAMAKGQIDMDAKVIETNSERIAFLAGMMHDYFALDTTNFEVKTGALPGIWKNHEDFSMKTDNMVKAASELNALAAANNSAEFRKGIGALGATCKACHDEYKAD